MSNERLRLYHQLQKAKRSKAVLKLINQLDKELRQDVHRLAAQIVAIARVTGFEAMQDGIALMEQEMKR